MCLRKVWWAQKDPQPSKAGHLSRRDKCSIFLAAQQGKADWKCLYVFYSTVFSVFASVGLSCTLKSLSVHLSIQWEGSLILKVLFYSRYFLLNFNFLNEKWGDAISRAFMQMLTSVGLYTLQLAKHSQWLRMKRPIIVVGYNELASV